MRGKDSVKTLLHEGSEDVGRGQLPNAFATKWSEEMGEMNSKMINKFYL
jgi:hypothetical protein